MKKGVIYNFQVGMVYLNLQTQKMLMMKMMTYLGERKTHPNITYTQAGVSCFVGQESGIFEVQFFVESSVVKIPACV